MNIDERGSASKWARFKAISSLGNVSNLYLDLFLFLSLSQDAAAAAYEKELWMNGGIMGLKLYETKTTIINFDKVN